MGRLIVNSIGVSSVQDGGRPALQRYGIAVGGAMDRLSLALANCLTGNPLSAAAIEIGPGAASFIIGDDSIRIALSGARRPVRIDDHIIASDCSVTIHPGAMLSLGAARDGVFSYLAIEGAIIGTATFGSLAVNQAAGLGSPYPRPLQCGDELFVGSATDRPERCIAFSAPSEGAIRIVFGPQDDEFEPDSRALLVNSDWRIAPESNRMGYRLHGPVLRHQHGHNIVSDGTVDGSIQVPGNGAPIVLMRDRGTTGGYPKIATVISADLGRFAQIPVGAALRFCAIDVAAAQEEARKFATLLQALPGQLLGAPAGGIDIAALHSANVAGQAISAVDPATWTS